MAEWVRAGKQMKAEHGERKRALQQRIKDHELKVSGRLSLFTVHPRRTKERTCNHRPRRPPPLSTAAFVLRPPRSDLSVCWSRPAKSHVTVSTDCCPIDRWCQQVTDAHETYASANITQ